MFVDLLKMLKSQLNFTYKIKKPPDNSYGILVNGSFSFRSLCSIETRPGLLVIIPDVLYMFINTLIRYSLQAGGVRWKSG